MGIDVGTEESKGVIVDGDAKIVAYAATTHSVEMPAPGHFEHDAETVWWGDVCMLSRRLLAQAGLPGAAIRAFGCSTCAADVLPVDADCNPLRKGILYGIDSRAGKEIAWLESHYGDRLETLWRGNEMGSSDCMPKVLWIKGNEPEVYARTHKFLTASSYITAKLTGVYAIDRYLAVTSFMPCYNADLSINDALAQECYCRGDQLAACFEATDVVGCVTAQAASETGLEAGTPVITGTDDSAAEAVSTGVLEAGDLMIQLGSTTYFIYCSDRLIDDARLWKSDFVVPGTFCVDGGTNCTGTLTKWMRDMLFPELVEAERSGGSNAYDAMAQLAEKVPTGADGLVVLPYFAGERTPVNDPDAKGMFFGLQLMHSRAHMYRAVLEGGAYAIAQHVRVLDEHNLPIRNFQCVGGGTKTPLWLQIIADVTGRTVRTSEVTTGACYGDALMAAIGTGHFPGFDSLRKVIRPGAAFHPDKDRHKTYQKYQGIYDALYPATKELMHLL
jgi:xylulokinase